MYRLLVLVHILAAIAWVGGGLVNHLAVRQARVDGGPVAADRQIVSLGWMERYIYIPAPVLVLLSGLAMVIVSDGWSFSQMWVYLALALFTVSAVLGGAVGGRLEKRMAELRANDQVDGPAYREVLRRTLGNNWVELAILVALVALMVYKPGV